MLWLVGCPLSLETLANFLVSKYFIFKTGRFEIFEIYGGAIDIIAPKIGHSAQVTLELVIGDRRIPLAQAAHDFAIVAEPTAFPPCDGEIVMTVDGQIDRMPVHLPSGCFIENRRFAIGQNSAS